MRFSVLGNPTTGYQWHYNDSENNKLFHVERNYVQDVIEGCEHCVGVGGTYYFTVTASDSIG